MSRYRNFVFTLNNPAVNCADAETLIAKLKEVCSFFIIGDEVGAQGTPHWQGYCELKTQTSCTVVNKWAKWHTETRRGTSKQARDYCAKEKILHEFGIMSAPGKRNDIAALKELALKEGLARVAEEATSMQQFKLCEVYMNYKSPPRDQSVEPDVTYITGPSGCGKSRLAYELLKGKQFYVKDETQWWTGYNGEEYVIMDDFRCSWMTHNMFIRLLDRYPMRVKVHGGLVQLRATHWILTSVIPPDQLYANVPEEPAAQVQRRIRKIITLPLAPEGPTDALSTHYSGVGVIVDPNPSEQDPDDNIGDLIYEDKDPIYAHIEWPPEG